MKLQDVASATVDGIRRVADELVRFARLERILATVCSFTPLVLIWADGTVRDSISAYYDMEQNQYFYFLLTVAAMLFITNGVIKRQHSYNIALGVLLAGVILFNLDDATVLHAVFALGFFAGNVVVILFYSRAPRIKPYLVAAIALSVVAFIAFDAFTVFWLEWVSLLAIATHYLLHVSPHVEYQAAARA